MVLNVTELSEGSHRNFLKGPYTRPYKKPKFELLYGNSRNHAEYLLHTAKNSAQILGTLYWRVDDPLRTHSHFSIKMPFVIFLHNDTITVRNPFDFTYTLKKDQQQQQQKKHVILLISDF